MTANVRAQLAYGDTPGGRPTYVSRVGTRHQRALTPGRTRSEVEPSDHVEKVIPSELFPVIIGSCALIWLSFALPPHTYRCARQAALVTFLPDPRSLPWPENDAY